VKLVECTCTPETVYADGSKPSFYTDEKKAVWMFVKLQMKAHAGSVRAQSELVVSPASGEVIRRIPPLPNLKDYNLYYGVHLNGLHIISTG
jgi:hypothetical protein